MLAACGAALRLAVGVLKAQADAAAAERMPFIRRGAALGVQAASAQLRAALERAVTALGSGR